MVIQLGKGGRVPWAPLATPMQMSEVSWSLPFVTSPFVLPAFLETIRHVPKVFVKIGLTACVPPILSDFIMCTMLMKTFKYCASYCSHKTDDCKLTMFIVCVLFFDLSESRLQYFRVELKC